MKRLIALLGVLVLVVAACSSDDDGSGDEGSETTQAAAAADDGADDPAPTASVLAAVQDRGMLNCGTRDALPGFAVLDESGEHVGFDSDFCRVIAAAVLGDANAVNHVDLETADRFTALQSGQIDVLVRNTTWTASRDGNEGATFVTTTFYDGQGMMVAADSGFASVGDLQNATICVAKGTTTEGNAAAEGNRLDLGWEVRPFDDVDLLQEAFLAGQCDGWSSDVSQLTGLRSAYPDGAEALTILPEVFSKEPLGPAVLDGDTQWEQVVNWAILATIQAEEFGITQANVDDVLSSTDDLNIQKFLGAQFETDDGSTTLDPGLGLPSDFAYQIVKQVGNYGEIFERHLAPLGLERGVNALWVDGGLMYAPPYR